MEGKFKQWKIAPEAKLAFQGIRCLVYQWQQKMFDGSFATFEKVVRIPCATVMATVDGKILVQEQEQPHRGPFLSLPGGHADYWEEPLEAVAKRELLEETGLESKDWELLVDLSYYDFQVFEHHLYVARNCYRVAEPRFDKGEKITTELVTTEAFKEIIQDPRWRHKDLTAYLNKDGNFDKIISLLKV